jgi:ubiquinone/menaquinone biosynthesis C-methylase UbiE
MTQNIYDDPEFFAGYRRLPRSVQGLAGAHEWPTLCGLLPELRGRTVLDLGCGFGWFCRWAREAGAQRVLGVDVSEKMLTEARARTADAAITYRCADLETLELPEACFDLAYSSLVLHYIEDLTGLLARVRRALRPGASLVFSAEHPIVTAPRQPRWTRGADGRKTWSIDGYGNEGRRVRDWLAKGVLKQHRTLATYLNLLVRRGFTIVHVEEWSPSDAQIAADPSLAEERERPMFLLVAARV